MPGTVVKTNLYNPSSLGTSRLPNFTEISWTSDSGGNVTALINLVGVIKRISFAPGSGGAQPTNNHVMTLTDRCGIDILRGQGAALSNTTATSFCPVIPATDGTNSGSAPITVAEDCTLTISGAGNAKSGRLILYH